MRVWSLLIIFSIILLQSKSSGEDTVADGIGIHQLERLVEMLTSKECKDLLWALSSSEESLYERFERLSPDQNILNNSKPGNPSLSIQVRRDAADGRGREDIVQQLGHPSPEKSKPDRKPRVTRIITDPAEREGQCRKDLTEWVLKNGTKTYVDRLSRALQKVGRTDIAVEVGKNLNQDKYLSLKHHVDGYHKGSTSKPLGFPGVKSDILNQETTIKGPQPLRRRLEDVTWSEMDLIIQRVPAPQTRLRDVLWPLVYGFQLCFGGAFLVGIFSLFIIHMFYRESR